MDGKIKVAVIAIVILSVVASAIYVAPTFAYMNGNTDQTRDRNMSQIRDRDCICNLNCERDQNQTHARLHIQECVSNPTSTGPAAFQYQWQNQYRYQNMRSP